LEQNWKGSTVDRKEVLQKAGIKPKDFCPMCWHKVKRLLDAAGVKPTNETVLGFTKRKLTNEQIKQELLDLYKDRDMSFRGIEVEVTDSLIRTLYTEYDFQVEIKFHRRIKEWEVWEFYEEEHESDREERIEAPAEYVKNYEYEIYKIIEETK